jgi:hypothetical protein
MVIALFRLEISTITSLKESNPMDLIPAYGRDYKTVKALKEDFESGKDFLESVTRRYINREDIISLGISKVFVRYGNLRKITSLAV